jgi:hypothetical protein
MVLQYENSFANSKIFQRCVISSEYSGNLTATLAVSFAAVFLLTLAFTQGARYYSRFSYIGMDALQNTPYCIIYVSVSHTHTHTHTHTHIRTHPLWEGLYVFNGQSISPALEKSCAILLRPRIHSRWKHNYL